MKKLYTFCLIACGLNFLSAQNYNFSKSTGTYTALSSPIVVSSASPWSSFQSHTVPIGFSFDFYDQTFSTIYIEGSGFTRFDINYFYLINPYTVEMQDAGTGGPTSLSPLSYLLTGTTPNRILKIQWENCEMVNDGGSFVNFQLWLYETSNTIEMHIGPTTINNPSAAFFGNANPGPVVGIFDYVQSIGKAANGTPPSEFGATLSSLTTVFDYSLSGVPANGAIYTFSMPLGMEDNNFNAVNIYPNPTFDEVNILLPYPAGFSLKNSMGQVVLEGVTNHTIKIETLNAGIYFLEFYLDGKYCTKKLLKQ